MTPAGPAAALKRLCGVRRVAFLFTGGDVAHTDAHPAPTAAGDDITSRRRITEERVTCRSAPRAPDAELAATAAATRAALRST